MDGLFEVLFCLIRYNYQHNKENGLNKAGGKQNMEQIKRRHFVYPFKKKQMKSCSTDYKLNATIQRSEWKAAFIDLRIDSSMVQLVVISYQHRSKCRTATKLKNEFFLPCAATLQDMGDHASLFAAFLPLLRFPNIIQHQFTQVRELESLAAFLYLSCP